MPTDKAIRTRIASYNFGGGNLRRYKMWAITVDIIFIFGCTMGLLDTTLQDSNIMIALMITAIIGNVLKLNYDLHKHYKKIGW